MSNVKIILLGDATEGLKYAPTAMWYAKKMRTDGLGHGMSRMLPLADGVMLRVNLDDNTGDKAYIESGGICRGWYMDSGLTDLVAAAPKHPGRGVPGKLLKGDSLRLNKMWGDISPSVFEHAPAVPQVEGDPLGALTANYPPVPTGDGIIPPAPLLPNATQAELQTWVDAATPDQISAWVISVNKDSVTAWHSGYEGCRDALATKKRAIRDCPSSLFHGKLRLWVQAIYGKKFSTADWTTKYTMAGKLAPSMTIKLPTTTNPNRAYTLNSNTTVLYTDDELNYWLIEIPSETGVTIRRLNLSLCGNVARDHLLTTAGKSLSREERARFESIMLQTAEPDLTGSFTMSTSIPAALRGVTLCYGWKANWGGSKADIVLHVQRQGPTSADADVYFDASHLSLTFKRDTKKVLTGEQTEKDRWTVTGSDTGFKKWMVTVTQHNIWVPDFDTAGTGLLRVFPPMECGVSRVAPTPISSTAPLYCFYDKDDKLQLVTYTQNIVGAHTDIKWPEHLQYYPIDGNQAVSLGGTGLGLGGMPSIPGSTNSWEKSVYTTHTTGGFSVAASITTSSYTFSGVWVSIFGNRPGNEVAATWGSAWAYVGTPQAGALYPGGATNISSVTTEYKGTLNTGDSTVAGLTAANGASYVNPSISGEPWAQYNATVAVHAGDTYGGFAAAFTRTKYLYGTYSFNNGTTISQTGNTALVVPYGDSCAVYVGTVNTTTESIPASTKGYAGTYHYINITFGAPIDFSAPTNFICYTAPGSLSGATWDGTGVDFMTYTGSKQCIALGKDLTPKYRPGNPAQWDYAAELEFVGPELNPAYFAIPISVTTWCAAGTEHRGTTTSYRFLGFNGTRDADPAFFNKPNDNPSGAMFDPGTIMAPQRYKPTNTSAQQFYTISSAVYGDTIGKTFTTGGYIIAPGDSILKGFIGFS